LRAIKINRGIFRQLAIWSVTAIISFLTTTAIADENSWSTNGPYDARVMAIAVDPSDNSRLYLGTVEYGMYLSTDAGQNWSHVDDELITRPIRKIIFNPAHPDTIWVGAVNGCLRSIDHGANWDRIIFPDGWNIEITSLAIHPTWPNIIFINGPWFTGINYMSTDGGQSWNTLSLTEIDVTEFLIDPVDDSTVYATSHNRTFRKSVYKSTDLGTTWTNMHSNLDTTTSIYSLAVDPDDNKIVYVCGLDWIGQNRFVYKSINGGEDWINISPAGLFEDWAQFIHVSSEDHNTIYLCTRGNGILRSTDAGVNWEEINDGSASRNIKLIEHDSQSDIWYLGTLLDGIYRSNGGDFFWEKISQNIPNTNCTDLAIAPDNPANQWVSAANGLYFTADYGQNWEYVDVLAPDYARETACITVNPFNSNDVFVGLSAGYIPAAIVRSLDGGATWNEYNQGLPQGEHFTKIRIGDYDTDTTIFMTSWNGLYKSNDYGESWYQDTDIPQVGYFDMDINPFDNNYIYIGGYNANSSSDGGASWTELNIPDIGTGYITAIRSNPLNPDEIYISIHTKGIYKSIDGGVGWTEITGSIPFVPGFKYFSGFAINRQNPANIFVYSYDHGVYQSHNSGESWEEFNEGLLVHRGIVLIDVDPIDTTRVYLANFSQSVWSIHRTPSGIADEEPALPTEIEISAYPNPFNHSTRLLFQLPISTNLSANIYNIRGQKVVELWSSPLPAGQHEILWDASTLSTGIYFFNLQAGDIKNTKKLILLK